MKLALLKLLTTGIRRNNDHLAETKCLDHALTKVDRVFGCSQFLNSFDDDFTVAYYTQSEIGYRLYHSSVGAVHMALNLDGVFHQEGYKVQPRIVAEQIRELKAKHVLEVGCGKGFNTLFLAKEFPDVQFVGIDLTPAHVTIANRNGAHLNNTHFRIGDFNALDMPSQSYDLVFACETLCHARCAKTMLAELCRVLRPGGKLVVFDGYRHMNPEMLPDKLLIATQLVETGMAVQHGFAQLTDWVDVADSLGLSVQICKDMTHAIQPTLLRLQSVSNQFFCSHWRARLFKILLPKYLVRNVVPGLLMPFTFHPTQGSLGYYQLVLRRF